MGSPWQWFCSTRTLSNCLETTYTIIALESWPWKWSLSTHDRETTVDKKLGNEENAQKEEGRQEEGSQSQKETDRRNNENPQKEESLIFTDELPRYVSHMLA